MKKSINIVLIGVLTVASIILALPFTPLRNSFKGVTSTAADKVLTSLGVDLNGKIKNARQISADHQYEASNMLIVDNKGRVIKSGSYGINSGVIYDNYNMGNFAMNGNTGNASVAGLNSNFGSGGSNRNSANAANQGIGGFVAISTKLGATNQTANQTGTATTKQSANGDNNGSGGGTHPGVDPVGGGGGTPSLPLGNGTSVLLVFIGIFGIWKVKSVLA